MAGWGRRTTHGAIAPLLHWMLLAPLVAQPFYAFAQTAIQPPEPYATRTNPREVQELTRRVLAGEDVSGIFLGQLHNDQSPLPLLIAMSRELLRQIHALDALQRKRAEAFLCDESIGIPLAECTPPAIEARLRELGKQQAEIEKKRSTSPPGQ